MANDAAPLITLVDSNVILDIVTDDAEWSLWSSQSLEAALDAGAIVLNPLVHAEASVGFDRIEDLDEVLPEPAFRREPLPYPAGFLAGKAFLRYRHGGGTKTSPLPDFYIGAHAAVAGYRLLTRDARRYRTYFPRVDVLSPTAG